MSQQVKKPLTCLQQKVHKNITVKLKNNIEYRGKLSNVDPYMNIILTDAEEYRSDILTSKYGKIVIRGNNVLFIRLEQDF